jgi:hypothetical protein
VLGPGLTVKSAFLPAVETGVYESQRSAFWLWKRRLDLAHFALVNRVRSSNGVFGLSLDLLSDNDSCSEATRFNDFDRNSKIPMSVFGSTVRRRPVAWIQNYSNVGTFLTLHWASGLFSRRNCRDLCRRLCKTSTAELEYS